MSFTHLNQPIFPLQFEHYARHGKYQKMKTYNQKLQQYCAEFNTTDLNYTIKDNTI